MNERRMLNLMANAIQRGVINRTDPDGSFAQVNGLSGRAKPDVEVFQPQGVHFRAPAGADGILAAASGDAGCSVFLSPGDRSALPLELLAEGEGGLHYLGTFKVFLNADGTLSLGAKIAPDFVALASKVDAALTAFELWAGTHVHAGVTTGGGTSGVAAPPAAHAPVGSLVVKAI